jgi:hypothetical protein
MKSTFIFLQILSAHNTIWQPCIGLLGRLSKKRPSAAGLEIQFLLNFIQSKLQNTFLVILQTRERKKIDPEREKSTSVPAGRKLASFMKQ